MTTTGTTTGTTTVPTTGTSGPGARTALDVSGTKPVSLPTLIKVEIRKMADTRAGLWLLATIVAITVLALAIAWFTMDAEGRTFFNLAGVFLSPQGLLLPVLGILLVTQEWGQRTAMVTFTLEPHSWKVIAAKVVAATLFGIAAVLLSIILAAAAVAVGGASEPWQNFGLDDQFKLVLLQVIAVLVGLGLGLVFLNSAAAIVTFFVLPVAFTLVANLWSALKDVAPWIDMNTSQAPLYSGVDMTGEQWGQLATSTLLWVGVPLVLGIWRVLRAEVK